MTENKQLVQTNDFLFQGGMIERLESFAGIMARGKSTVPQHLRNNPADCMAVIMQAAEWRMNPFAVAQKTYQVAPGAPLGYEGQLVNAVIITHAPIHGRPDYT
ncbi:MAG: recombinase RecT, partial [Chloroflexi bacterium]|nr:recombinase RecT [Chloroflexota bacterium]